jgi:spore coat protein U-like protein
MKTSHLLLTAIAMITGVSLSTAASAATATGSLNAKIVITSNCAITGTSTDLDFGSNASTTASAVSASNGGFSVTCTNQTPYTIGLKSTASGAADDGTGTMKATVGGTAYTIGYQLYQDSGTTVWGNVASGGSANVKSSIGTGTAQAFTVYGKTTSTLNVPAATYSDVVAINVEY